MENSDVGTSEPPGMAISCMASLKMESHTPTPSIDTIVGWGSICEDLNEERVPRTLSLPLWKKRTGEAPSLLPPPCPLVETLCGRPTSQIFRGGGCRECLNASCG